MTSDLERIAKAAERAAETVYKARHADADLAAMRVWGQLSMFFGALARALPLVPEGWAWMVGCAPEERFFATLQICDGVSGIDTDGLTPALALAVAALKAREANP